MHDPSDSTTSGQNMRHLEVSAVDERTTETIAQAFQEQEQAIMPSIEDPTATPDSTPTKATDDAKVLKQRYDTEFQSTSADPPSNIPFSTIRPLYHFSGDLEQQTISLRPSKQQQQSPLSIGQTRSSSPRLHSPASSQIFERSVQDDIVPAQASPSIPSHIITENHIPPILEASSAAITDEHLDPDFVEIITHSIHQTAANTVAGASEIDHAMVSSSANDHDTGAAVTTVENEDSVSTYGAIDSSDVPRLSFISFADVVHAEHVENGDQARRRDSLHSLTLLTSPGSQADEKQSVSPLHSPVSSEGMSPSPPTSMSPSSKGLEPSARRGSQRPGSPLSPYLNSPSAGTSPAEFNVETMRQALRRTGSGDFTVARVVPMSGSENTETR
jgi:hypothetical protein